MAPYSQAMLDALRDRLRGSSDKAVDTRGLDKTLERLLTPEQFKSANSRLERRCHRRRRRFAAM
jgi:hypothetical protein